MQIFYTQQLATPQASSSDILHVHTKMNWLNWIPQYYVFTLKKHYCLLLFYVPLINNKMQEVYRHNTSLLFETATCADGPPLMWYNMQVLMRFWEFGKTIGLWKHCLPPQYLIFLFIYTSVGQTNAYEVTIVFTICYSLHIGMCSPPGSSFQDPLMESLTQDCWQFSASVLGKPSLPAIVCFFPGQRPVHTPPPLQVVKK